MTPENEIAASRVAGGATVERVVRTLFLISAAYLLGGADGATAGDVLADQDRRLVEEPCRENGDAPEEASPPAAAGNSGESAAGD